MPGEALLRLAEEAPMIVVALLLGAFALFALGMRPPYPGESRRIVIIDDDPEVRLALRRLIQNRTTLRIVGEAADGAEGLSVVDAVVPDAVVIDVKMPVMDGVQATRKIKELHPYIKVVGFSSADDDPTGEIMRYAGASTSIVKGDSPDAIIETLLEVV